MPIDIDEAHRVLSENVRHIKRLLALNKWASLEIMLKDSLEIVQDVQTELTKKESH